MRSILSRSRFLLAPVNSVAASAATAAASSASVGRTRTSVNAQIPTPAPPHTETTVAAPTTAAAAAATAPRLRMKQADHAAAPVESPAVPLADDGAIDGEEEDDVFLDLSADAIPEEMSAEQEEEVTTSAEADSVPESSKVIDESKLFGVGRVRTKEQQQVYEDLKGKTLQEAFPDIASSWVGLCWGSVMITPSNVPPTSNRIAIWRCNECLQEFERSIAQFVDDHGTCPLCNKKQRSGAAAAPRAIHTVYSSVLHCNPDWMNRNIQPMLAQKWETVAPQVTPDEALLVSPKIDGIRCLIGFNERKKEPQFFSRGGILLECCDGLRPHVMPLFERDPSLILDGELFAPQCNFEQLSGLVRRVNRQSTPELKQHQADLLEYFAFDVMYSSQLEAGQNAPFKDRYKLLKQLIPVCGAKRISNYQHDDQKKKVFREDKKDLLLPNRDQKVFHVPAALINVEDIDEVLLEACSQGFEGVMIRRPAFPYEHGKRSFGLLKYKTMHDAEYKVVDFLAGQGKMKGRLGAFICETKNGIRFNATPKVSMKKRKQLWLERESLLGKYLTVQYQELSRQDVPRFPVAKAIRGGDNREEWM